MNGWTACSCACSCSCLPPVCAACSCSCSPLVLAVSGDQRATSGEGSVYLRLLTEIQGGRGPTLFSLSLGAEASSALCLGGDRWGRLKFECRGFESQGRLSVGRFFKTCDLVFKLRKLRLELLSSVFVVPFLVGVEALFHS